MMRRKKRMRPIDADDLKKSLNNYVFNDPTCPMHIAATVDQYIDFAPTVGGWISCSERMPDEDSYKWAVGITSTGRCIAFQEHNAYENDTGGISVPTYLAHGSEITRWMPIPEPPGGDNNA
jgi:hypothetical protein